MAVSPDILVEAFIGGAWVPLPDVLEPMGLTIRYGIDGNGPADVVASPGELSFGLDNSASNSEETEGYYSPRHADALSGWGLGVPIRVTFSFGGNDYVKFRGKTYGIDPMPGVYRDRSVEVTCYDGIYELMEADARELVLRTNVQEDVLIDDILDALPVEAQPFARSLDDGVNLFPVAFDKLGGGEKALAVIRDVVLSVAGRAFIAADGTFTYINRHNFGPLAVSVLALADETLNEFGAPSSVDRLFNRIRITTHRKTVSAAATDVLHDSVVQLGAGEMQEIWADYSDPNDRQTAVGGAGPITKLVTGNTAEDGTGVDVTASITSSLTPFASTGLFTVTNTGGNTAFARLRILGRAIRDLGPQTSEFFSPQPYGDRLLSIDLPYQDSVSFGQGFADYYGSVYSDLETQLDFVEFFANEDAATLVQAMTREIGDRITVSEAMTGTTLADGMIHHVEMRVFADALIWCRWGLSPASTLGQPWQLGHATFGQLGITTILGL